MPASHFWWLLRGWRTSWFDAVGRGVMHCMPEPSSRKISTAWNDGPNVIRWKQSRKKRSVFWSEFQIKKHKWQRFAWKAALPKDLEDFTWMVSVSQSCSKTLDLKLNAILGIVEKSLLSRMLGMIALICSNRVTPSPHSGSGRLFHLRKPIHGPLWMSHVTYVREKVWCWER